MVETKRRLLLVEDTENDEFLSLQGIRRSGVPCDVEIFRHGGEALAALLDNAGPPPDLVVLDFHLPGLTGLEVLRELRRNERTRRVPVVILSNQDFDLHFSKCIEAGANSCVVKPFDAQLYVERVGLIVRYWFTVDQRPERTPAAC